MKKKQMSVPCTCDRCQKVVRNPVNIHHGREDSWTPPGQNLCTKCWSALDDYLCKKHWGVYLVPWKAIDPVNIPRIHEIGRQWIRAKNTV